VAIANARRVEIGSAEAAIEIAVAEDAIGIETVSRVDSLGKLKSRHSAKIIQGRSRVGGKGQL
jgi:hypothetical protein